MAEGPDTAVNSLLAPRFLFQFAVPARRREGLWPRKPAAGPLDDACALPDLAALDRRTPAAERRFADVRLAWSSAGLLVTVEVAGKRQPPWCRDTRLEESDGLQVWIDTRATHNVHRATKFCSRFVFLPGGAGRDFAEPVADQLLINRARENARPVRPRELQVAAELGRGGYTLAAWVPAVTMQGYDPEQHRQLGFHYAVTDRELGVQTFANGAETPYDEDPSCWATLDLVS